jgi:hypothetical protein
MNAEMFRGLVADRIASRLLVAPCVRTYPRQVYTRRLRVVANDRTCALHELTAVFRRRSRVCGAFAVTRRVIDDALFSIIWFHPPEAPEVFFVVPTARIRAAHFASPGTNRTQICFPAFRPAEPTGKARLDLWEFADAWHLLLS